MERKHSVITPHGCAVPGALELRAGISAALRQGFQIEPSRVRFAFMQAAAFPGRPRHPELGRPDIAVQT